MHLATTAFFVPQLAENGQDRFFFSFEDICELIMARKLQLGMFLMLCDSLPR